MAFLVYMAIGSLAVVLTQQRKDASFPVGLTPAFAITALPDAMSRAEQVEALRQAAAAAPANLYLRVPNMEDIAHSVVLYVFEGDAEAQRRLFPLDRYPSFSPAFVTELRRADQLGFADLAGLYFTNADAGPVGGWLARLRSAGFACEAVADPPPPTFLLVARVEPLLTAGLV
ncbi:MAG: hypothetical protein LBH76_06560, partial [Propionibacteriaceae bacterium]|nr:hypothetical protein [Propionibacteriaceae bacterium]